MTYRYLRMGKMILLIGLLLIVASCVPSQLKIATLTANSVADFADSTHDVLAFSYQHDQEECVNEAKEKAEAVSCVANVRQRYRSAWTYYRALRRAWLILASAIHAAKTIDDSNDPRIAPILAELVAAQGGFRSVANALEEQP